MASKKGPSRDQERRDEIAEEFRVAQLEESTTNAHGVVSAGKKYEPQRFARPDDQRLAEMLRELLEPRDVPEHTRFAAAVVVDSLSALAAGESWVPRLVPTDADKRIAWSIMTTSRVSLAGGGRAAFAGDHALVRRLFRAIFGVPPERYWEIVLERALRDAIALRFTLPVEDARLEALGRREVAAKLPTAQDVVAVVREMSLPGTVPDFLTAEVIELAFEQCTDAERGGGRGNAKKVSVAKWIAKLKSGARAARKTRR